MGTIWIHNTLEKFLLELPLKASKSYLILVHQIFGFPAINAVGQTLHVCSIANTTVVILPLTRKTEPNLRSTMALEVYQDSFQQIKCRLLEFRFKIKHLLKPLKSQEWHL